LACHHVDLFSALLVNLLERVKPLNGVKELSPTWVVESLIASGVKLSDLFAEYTAHLTMQEDFWKGKALRLYHSLYKVMVALQENNPGKAEMAKIDRVVNEVLTAMQTLTVPEADSLRQLYHQLHARLQRSTTY